jgi:hypothetical protein
VKPVRTAESNLVYVGPPGTDVKDLHCYRARRGVILSVWQLSPEDRELVARGANVLLTISTEPIPPVAVSLTWAKGVGEDAPELEERMAALRRRRVRIVNECICGHPPHPGRSCEVCEHAVQELGPRP